MSSIYEDAEAIIPLQFAVKMSLIYEVIARPPLDENAEAISKDPKLKPEEGFMVSKAIRKLRLRAKRRYFEPDHGDSSSAFVPKKILRQRRKTKRVKIGQKSMDSHIMKQHREKESLVRQRRVVPGAAWRPKLPNLSKDSEQLIMSGSETDDSDITSNIYSSDSDDGVEGDNEQSDAATDGCRGTDEEETY